MKTLKLISYDQEGNIILNTVAKAIDICDSHTVVFAIGFTHVIPFSISSINIVDGTVTVYFLNGSYMIITKLK
jgi:hypothetical protein